MFDVANMLKKMTAKDVSIENYDLLNIHAYSFNMFLEHKLPPIFRGKLQVLSSSPIIL